MKVVGDEFCSLYLQTVPLKWYTSLLAGFDFFQNSDRIKHEHEWKEKILRSKRRSSFFKNFNTSKLVQIAQTSNLPRDF